MDKKMTLEKAIAHCKALGGQLTQDGKGCKVKQCSEGFCSELTIQSNSD